MRTVGLLCNCSSETSPKDELSPSLVNRAFLIDRLLRPDGVRLFLYSPREITSMSDVPGYGIEGDDLVATREAPPRVNANWTYGTRRLINQGMGYRRFKRWAKENRVGIYVPYAFSELVSNKTKAHAVVEEYAAGLHPYTENYESGSVQIQSFLERSELVFIKPRAGNRGNEIFVLRRAEDGLSLKYYDQGGQRVFSRLTLEAAVGVLAVAAGEKTYIIQQGIESLRYEGSVFDIRVVMVNDGRQWHSLLETRLAPQGSDLSNVFQGGSIRVTEDLLDELLGGSAALALQAKIRSVSHGLAEHLESLYPTELMEIGFDFVLDSGLELHLVEVNAKPGVAGFGSETKLFEWKPEDEPYYEKWVYPHVAHLAGFLKAKVESLPSLISEA